MLALYILLALVGLAAVHFIGWSQGRAVGRREGHHGGMEAGKRATVNALLQTLPDPIFLKYENLMYLLTRLRDEEITK